MSNRLGQEKQISAAFLAEGQEDKMLVFWGYVGCGTVCPISMAALRNVYVSYQAEYPEEDLAVVFIGLPLPGEQPLPGSADKYAKIFHEDFRGYNLSAAAMSQAVREFDVSFSPSLTNPEIVQHSAFIYLLQREGDDWVLKRTYTDNPPQPDTILADLQTLSLQATHSSFTIKKEHP
ncbi:MAG: SCO family protein [Anaerolineae bacterium]|nr:SCO family protein [Anaerolineae bacterium]